MLDENPFIMDHASIFAALASNTSLTKLSMSNAGLTARTVGDLAEALEVNTALRELNLSKNNLQVIGAHALADGLAKNHSIRVLDVSWNAIGVVGLQAILDSLNGRPVRLNLTCNNISIIEVPGMHRDVSRMSLSSLSELLAQLHAIFVSSSHTDPECHTHASLIYPTVTTRLPAD